jgi:hypothetical protein
MKRGSRACRVESALNGPTILVDLAFVWEDRAASLAMGAPKTSWGWGASHAGGLHERKKGKLTRAHGDGEGWTG